MRNLVVLLSSVCLTLLASPRLDAQVSADRGAEEGTEVTYTVEGSMLRILAVDGNAREVALPCHGHALAAGEDTLYVACGEAGLLLLSLQDPLEPTVAGFRDLGGSVTGLFVAQDRIWAQISRIEARPVEAGTTVPTPSRVQVTTSGETPELREPSATVSPPVAETRTVGEVIEVRAGEVVVNLGTDQGIARRNHVELFVEEQVDIGSGSAAVTERRIAVGEVRALTEDRAQVALGMNERVPSHARARHTDLALTSNNWLPPRVSGLWEIGFMARPFLALGTMGAGMVTDLEVAYRFPEPVVIELMLEPLGIGFAEEGNVISLAGNLFASYDTPAFQVGLGLGWTVVNDDLTGDMVGDADNGRGIDLTFDEVSHGLSIAQIARLGARDGLHLLVTNHFVLHEEEFKYGGTRGTIQVPLPTGDTRTWLIARGGGGTAGYAFGEIGLRVMLRGNGDRGSLFVTPTIGGAYLQGQKEVDCQIWDYETNTTVPGTCTEKIDYGGPMVGFGMEWRL
ncbi:MAG: hypothetical protein JW797_01740 [Bradymonadales bacterium]|nr:hypothetical protein [Bradymonadales bacterium]